MHSRRIAALFVTLIASFLPFQALGQFLVDCSGNTPGAYTSINSVVPLLSNGASVSINGPCNENVNISGLSNLWIGGPWGQPRATTLQGNLTFNGVQNLFLYGINVTNPSGDGMFINNSYNVALDNCTSSNNGNRGLVIYSSTVYIQDTGAFDNNGSDGINASGSGQLTINGYSGPTSVSNNLGDGIALQDGAMNAGGALIISNNKANPTTLGLGSNPAGFGINLWGHARGVLVGIWNTNIISGNQAGGIGVHEGSEFSVCCTILLPPGVTLGTIIDGNGPVGASAGFGSQLTIWDGVQISNHSDAGVEIYGHSQLLVNGNDQIINNGAGSPSVTSAGVRIDGNSEAYVRGGQFTQNGGPGILALTNSSIDLSGATFASNLGGAIACDSSSWLVADQAAIAGAHGHPLPCSVPNAFGPQHRSFAAPRFSLPDVSRMKAQQAKYKQLMSSF
jgi:hypothetical protein